MNIKKIKLLVHVACYYSCMTYKDLILAHGTKYFYANKEDSNQNLQMRSLIWVSLLDACGILLVLSCYGSIFHFPITVKNSVPYMKT